MKKIAWIIAMFWATAMARAELKLDSAYGEHMLFQQGRPAVLRGQAKPKSDIIVLFDKVRGIATADDKGRFEASLTAPKAGGPYKLVLQSGSDKIEWQDIMVGELWLAAGQSNMEWSLAADKQGEKSLAKAKHDDIRLIQVSRDMRGLQATWARCNAESARGFSAVAYYFALELQKKLKVPIGLINASWGGTPIEPWVPLAAYAKGTPLEPALKRWQARPAAEKRMYSDGWKIDLEFKDLTLIKADGTREELKPLIWSVNSAPWAQTQIDEKLHYTGLLGPGSWAGAYGSLGENGAPKDLNAYEAFEFKSRGNTRSDAAFGQESVKDGDNYAWTFFDNSKDWQTHRFAFKDLKQQGWGKKQPLDLKTMHSVIFRTQAPNQFPDEPGLLYSRFIEPFAALSPQGALWYQGESNVDRAGEYAALLKAMALGWRQGFKRDDLAVLVVQLPEFGHDAEGSLSSGWAELREAQGSILELDKGGLAISLGAGEPDDVHPKDKQPVGQRLAWEALSLTYGLKGYAGQGPVLDEAKASQGKIVLKFNTRNGGLRSLHGVRVKGFTAESDDGKRVVLKAQLRGQAVVISPPAELKLKSLRYAWGSSPDFSLVDKRGVPAKPFRISWPQ